MISTEFRVARTATGERRHPDWRGQGSENKTPGYDVVAARMNIPWTGETRENCQEVGNTLATTISRACALLELQLRREKGHRQEPEA